MDERDRRSDPNLGTPPPNQSVGERTYGVAMEYGWGTQATFMNLSAQGIFTGTNGSTVTPFLGLPFSPVVPAFQSMVLAPPTLQTNQADDVRQ